MGATSEDTTSDNKRRVAVLRIFVGDVWKDFGLVMRITVGVRWWARVRCNGRSREVVGAFAVARFCQKVNKPKVRT